MKYRVLALVLSLTVSTFAQANLLANAGFESGVLTPWAQTTDFGGAENWNVTSADAYTGVYSATNRGNKLIEQFIVPVATSDITSITFALKNVDGSINAINLLYSDATKSQDLIFHTDSEWHVYDWTSHLVAGKQLVSFGVFGYDGGGATNRTYLDDVDIEVVPEPATLSVLGLGLLGFLRKRKA